MDIIDAERKINGYQRECHDVEQNLGIALGYPRYADDPKNFPGATDTDGVCIGAHTPASISMEAAQRITGLRAQVDNAIPQHVVDALALQLSQALLGQVTLCDFEYPPRAEQGPVQGNRLVGLVTAVDVNHWINQIRQLMSQNYELEAKLTRVNMQRDATYAKVDAIEESFNVYLKKTIVEKERLNNRIAHLESTAIRALQLIADHEQRPITHDDTDRASALLAQFPYPGATVTGNGITGYAERGGIVETTAEQEQIRRTERIENHFGATDNTYAVNPYTAEAEPPRVWTGRINQRDR